MQEVRVGRVVHYVGKNGAHVAAIVSHVVNKENGIVDLQAFQTDDLALAQGQATQTVSGSRYSEKKEPETWHTIEEGWIP